MVDYYHCTLLDSPRARAYLERRGQAWAEAVETFRLGFANRTLGLRPPMANRRVGAEIRQRLQRLRILRQSGHEHFNGSLVVPVCDEDGRITEVYGRKVAEAGHPRAGTPMHLYLPGPHRGVWNVAALAAGEEVIVRGAARRAAAVGALLPQRDGGLRGGGLHRRQGRHSAIWSSTL